MQLKNTVSRYGIVTIAFHWVMALAIMGVFGIGFYMVDLSYYDTLYRTLPYWHKSVGVLIGLALIARVAWKISTPSPAPLTTHKRYEKRAAKVVHMLMYALMGLIVITGYLISTAAGKELEVFTWFTIPSLGSFVENQESLAGEVHEWLANSLIIIVILHAAGALKHHFIDKDNTLTRMLGKSSQHEKQ